MEKEFTIGCDPELFLRKGKEFVSAIPYVDGTKSEPQIMASGGNIQRDNVALEFGTLPAKNLQEFVSNVRDTIRDMRDSIPKQLEIVAVSSANFPRKELDHPEAKKFGCAPDFDAYEGGQPCSKPEGCEKDTFRSCGGHVHIGYVEHGFEFLRDYFEVVEFVKLLDVILAFPSVLLDNTEESRERRKLYGKPGCYRKTDYGVEYRTLSNFWVKDRILTALIYSLVEDALKEYDTNAGKLVEEITEKEILRVIETGDESIAFEWVNDLESRGILSMRTIGLLRDCMGSTSGVELKW